MIYRTQANLNKEHDRLGVLLSLYLLRRSRRNEKDLGKIYRVETGERG